MGREWVAPRAICSSDSARSSCLPLTRLRGKGKRSRRDAGGVRPTRAGNKPAGPTITRDFLLGSAPPFPHLSTSFRVTPMRSASVRRRCCGKRQTDGGERRRQAKRSSGVCGRVAGRVALGCAVGTHQVPPDHAPAKHPLDRHGGRHHKLPVLRDRFRHSQERSLRAAREEERGGKRRVVCLVR